MEFLEWLQENNLISVATLIIGSLLGFFFGQAERLLRRRGEKKRVYGKALSELLSARIEVLAFKKLDAAYDDVGMSEMHQIGAKEAMTGGGAYGVARERFNDALEQVAELNPILAVKLRRSDWTGYYLQVLRGLNVLNPEAAEGVLQHERSLTDLDIDDIEVASLTLARKHGILTWVRCKMYFRKSNDPLGEIPAPIQEIIGSLSSEVGRIEAEMVGKD
jgi:hypothetical protein